MLNVHQIIECTESEGPGKRFCIWVQGCSHRCEGCFAKDTWNESAGTQYSTSAIIEAIKRNKAAIEGITLLGGEPFDQAAALSRIAIAAQELNLSVMAFTGYTYKQLLEKKDKSVKRLITAIDLLIDGPYIQKKRDFSRPWVGSSNQRFIFLTDRYNAKTIQVCNNTFEIRIDNNGSILINGMGRLEQVRHALEAGLLS